MKFNKTNQIVLAMLPNSLSKISNIKKKIPLEWKTKEERRMAVPLLSCLRSNYFDCNFRLIIATALERILRTEPIFYRHNSEENKEFQWFIARLIALLFVHRDISPISIPSAFHFVRIPFIFISFDSSQRARLSIFLVRRDWTQRSAANRRKPTLAVEGVTYRRSISLISSRTSDLIEFYPEAKL